MLVVNKKLWRWPDLITDLTFIYITFLTYKQESSSLWCLCDSSNDGTHFFLTTYHSIYGLFSNSKSTPTTILGMIVN